MGGCLRRLVLEDDLEAVRLERRLLRSHRREMMR